MFKKNARVTYELLPDGRIYIETAFSSNIEESSEFFAGLFNKTYLHDTMRSIKHFGSKKSRNGEADEIVGYILDSQRDYTPQSDKPIIEADQVFYALQQRIGNGEE